jgi:hypothetical protein
MLIATGVRRVMSAGMFIIGLVLLWAAVSSRLARRELRNAELADDDASQKPQINLVRGYA